ncbi:hypothetical protein HYPSUDRAFT_66932 [Hypholoma sublateritium FD-334 SS-4]|uniref:Uncharacterized protein n=1 Tax=Hypholoma sublateritium (strain FD-334 SS-4) TaxID=945553 RepID=A0A0D2P213_HYPSF|nr:hypothetical protein HYPSUDRAFT_66932 [Hypholoma sublateritium FD-334 SS-4]
MSAARPMPTPPDQQHRRPSNSPGASDASSPRMRAPSTPMTTPTFTPTPPPTPASASTSALAPASSSTEDATALAALLAEVDEWLLHIGARVAELERRHWAHRAREGALLAGAGVGGLGVGGLKGVKAGRV